MRGMDAVDALAASPVATFGIVDADRHVIRLYADDGTLVDLMDGECREVEVRLKHSSVETFVQAPAVKPHRTGICRAYEHMPLCPGCPTRPECEQIGARCTRTNLVCRELAAHTMDGLLAHAVDETAKRALQRAIRADLA